MPLPPETTVGVDHPGATGFSVCDPAREALEPFFEVVRPFTGGIEVKVKKMVGIEVNNPVAQSADFMKLNELLVDSAQGIDVGEGVVAGQMGGPGVGDEVVELTREWFNLPSPSQQVIFWEGHDLDHIAHNEQVASEPKRRDAGEELHCPNRSAPETAGYPLDCKVLDACHVFEVFEGSFTIKHVPQRQPIGEHRDHAGVVAHDLLSRP